jgi:hypothetical protein
MMEEDALNELETGSALHDGTYTQYSQYSALPPPHSSATNGSTIPKHIINGYGASV